MFKNRWIVALIALSMTFAASARTHKEKRGHGRRHARHELAPRVGKPAFWTNKSQEQKRAFLQNEANREALIRTMARVGALGALRA